MQNPPLDVERCIGWISLAIGASLLQPNDSVLYEIVHQVASTPAVLIYTFLLVSMSLIAATYYTHRSRCRIVLLVLLDLMWAGILALIAFSGPLGATGALAGVLVSYLSFILFKKARALNGS